MFAALLLATIGMLAVEATPPTIGAQAPELDLPTLDGRQVRRGDLLGRVTLVEFSATWCGPCDASRADLTALRRKFGPRLQVVIVDVAETRERIRRFYARRPLPESARLLVDRDGHAARRWGVARYPTTFFIDALGVVRHINRGHGSGFAARAARWLDGMLQR